MKAIRQKELFAVNNNDIHLKTNTTPQQEYFFKRYNNLLKKEPYFDFVLKKDGKLHTKFPTDSKYIAGQLMEPSNNLSIRGNTLNDMGISPSLSSNYSLSQLKPVVNDDYIPTVLKNVKTDPRYQLDGLSNTHFKVLDTVQKALTDEIDKD